MKYSIILAGVSWLFILPEIQMCYMKRVLLLHTDGFFFLRQTMQHLPDRDQDPDILIRQTPTEASYSFA